MSTSKDDTEATPASVLISGAGIIGLVLALGLKKQVGVTAEVYAKAATFPDDVGAALGMYSNGLRVIRNIDESLFAAIVSKGVPYGRRCWERHDGTVVAEASEEILSEYDADLRSFGIRRWCLHRILYDFALQEGITVHFSKATSSLVVCDDGIVQVGFEDGTSRRAHIVFGADGCKSGVRKMLQGSNAELKYSGVTSLMGISNYPREESGICFPTSTSSHCHAVFFPTGTKEQCFQIHIPLPVEETDESYVGALQSCSLSRKDMRRVAERFRREGWDEEKYVQPLLHVKHAVKVGFATLTPRLEHWVYGVRSQIVLVGDAAHPPVPYVGQGAQMGLEDVGVLLSLMKHLCQKCATSVEADTATDNRSASQSNEHTETKNTDGFEWADFAGGLPVDVQDSWDSSWERKEQSKSEFVMEWDQWARVTYWYEQLRIPRVAHVLDCSEYLGLLQESRGSTIEAAALRESLLQEEVALHGTLPALLPGATYDYEMEVAKAMKQEEKEQRRRRGRAKWDLFDIMPQTPNSSSKPILLF